MKDFIKVERTFDVDKFFVGHAYHIYSETLKEGHTCLLKSKSSNRLEFIYFDDGETIPYYIRLYPNDFIDDDYTITEAIYKVDVPEVKIVSEWKTIKEAFDTPGYFNNGDCYEIKDESQTGPFSKTLKGFLTGYYPTSEKLRFIIHARSSNVAAVKQHYWYNYITMKPECIDSYEIIEESVTNGAVVDIEVKETTDDVKIRRLN